MRDKRPGSYQDDPKETEESIGRAGDRDTSESQSSAESKGSAGARAPTAESDADQPSIASDVDDDETVFISAKASRYGYSKYHSDRQCRYVQRMDDIRETSRSVIESHYDECEDCLGESTTSSQPETELATRLRRIGEERDEEDSSDDPNRPLVTDGGVSVTMDDLSELTSIHCGCGEYAIAVPAGALPDVIDVVCPECNNHFGHGAPPDRPCPCQHDHNESKPEHGGDWQLAIDRDDDPHLRDLDGAAVERVEHYGSAYIAETEGGETVLVAGHEIVPDEDDEQAMTDGGQQLGRILAGRHGSYHFDTDAAREFRCPVCDARCTDTPNSGEVGHKIGCPRRPDGLPAGGNGGASYYQGEDDEDDERVLADGGQDIDHVLVKSNSSSKRRERKKYHLPDPDDPDTSRCAIDVAMVRKQRAQIPHHRLCKRCDPDHAQGASGEYGPCLAAKLRRIGEERDEEDDRPEPNERVLTDGGFHIAPCPSCETYAGIRTVITTSTDTDDPAALRLGCGCEVRFEFFEGEGEFADADHFPDDPEVVEAAMYESGSGPEPVTDGGHPVAPSDWPYAAVVHGADADEHCLAVTGAGDPCTNNAYGGDLCGMHSDADDPDVLEGAHQWARIHDRGTDRVVAVCVNCEAVWEGGEPPLAVACPTCGRDPGRRCDRDRERIDGGTTSPVPPHPARRERARETLDEYDYCPAAPFRIQADVGEFVTDGGWPTDVDDLLAQDPFLWRCFVRGVDGGGDDA